MFLPRLAPLALLCVACGPARSGRPPEPGPADLSSRIDRVAEAALREGPVAGLSIAVVHGDEVLHSAGYGVTDLGARTPAGPDTRHDLASVGKILTAAAVLTLVDAGRLDLDDELGDRLPALADLERVRSITVRQLLDHTSGLHDYVADDVERWERTGEPLEPEFVLEHVRTHALDFEPGSSWRYSSTGFYLAGLVVEEVTGEPWNEYTLRAVARPLGLRDLAHVDDPRARRTRGFDVTGAGLAPSVEANEAGLGGDGGFCGTALDMARIPRVWTTTDVLSEASRAEMLRPATLSDGRTVGYGLGVALGNLEGHALQGHLGGNQVSYVATLAHYPERDVSVAVLVNTRFGDVGALQVEASVARVVLDLPAEPLRDLPSTTEELDAWTGTYVGDRGEHVLMFEARDGRLVRTSVDGVAAELPLRRQGPDTFAREDWPLDRLVFTRRGGRAVALSLHYNGFFDGYYERVAEGEAED